MNMLAFRRIFVIISLLSLGFLIGCANMEFAPKDPYPYWYYPKELPEADRAVAEAFKAGKNKECPAEFKAAEDLKNKAYEIYAACRTKEAIDMAKDATKKAKALCPKKHAKVIDKMTSTVLFDFNKSEVRKDAEAELKKVLDFVKKYPGAKFKVEGHTDGIGSEKYNQGLSERRAEAIKNYLIKEGGVDKGMISSTGYGKTKPIAPNKTKDGKDNPEGRAKNRRVEILVLTK